MTSARIGDLVHHTLRDEHAIITGFFIFEYNHSIIVTGQHEVYTMMK